MPNKLSIYVYVLSLVCDRGRRRSPRLRRASLPSLALQVGSEQEAAHGTAEHTAHERTLSPPHGGPFGLGRDVAARRQQRQ